MTPTRHTMSVLAQITNWMPDRITETLAKKHRIQTRSFSATSHVISMVYAHLAHALSLNDIEKNRSPSAQSHPKTTHFIKLRDGCENNFEPRMHTNGASRE